MSATIGRTLQVPTRTLCLLIGMVLLHGCAGTSPPEESAPAAERAPDYGHGAYLYQLHCSACHDRGEKDAPTLDDIEAWDERAFQWEAVLKQHVSQGFLNMPPDGEDGGLTEQDLDDVLFFMVTKMRALDE